MNPFDSYSIKARIAPALIVLLPLATVAVAWFPKLASVPGLVLLGAGTMAAAVIVARQTRETGVALEKGLVEQWGAMPTTILLRHADTTLGPDEKARYHAMLQERVPGIRIPDPQIEVRDPKAADRNYEMAVGWLREQTRGNPIVNDENTTYGFYRNLCAIRVYGVITAVIGIVGSTALLLFGKADQGLDYAAVISLAVSLVAGSVVLFHATADEVRKAGFSYAKALIRAIDATGKPG